MARARFAPIRRVDPAAAMGVGRQMLADEDRRRAEEAAAEEAFRQSAERALPMRFRRDAPDPLASLEARVTALEARVETMTRQLDERTL